jgi:hypothetical protein
MMPYNILSDINNAIKATHYNLTTIIGFKTGMNKAMGLMTGFTDLNNIVGKKTAHIHIQNLNKTHMLNKCTIISMLFILLFAATKAQDLNNELISVPASGGNATGTSGSAGYTVGQVFYSYFESVHGSITEGIQQAFDIEVQTSADNTLDIQLSCSLYPNPATDYVILNISIGKWNDLWYNLIDTDGILLESKNVVNAETRIEIGDYPPSIYYLHLVEGQVSLKTFKIIKH